MTKPLFNVISICTNHQGEKKESHKLDFYLSSDPQLTTSDTLTARLSVPEAKTQPKEMILYITCPEIERGFLRLFLTMRVSTSNQIPYQFLENSAHPSVCITLIHIKTVTLFENYSKCRI